MTVSSLVARLACLVSFAAPAAAQNALFFEDFSSGMPAGWTHQTLGVSIDPWSPGFSPATSSPDMFHEWFCLNGFYFRDNRLVSPRIDLTGFSQADFSCVQHQALASSRQLNRVEISTDGGVTFAPLYTETGQWNGPGTIQVDLNAWAGLPDVRIGFHYQGTVANEWRIDDVKVTTSQPVLDVNGGSAGATTTFALSGCQPGAFVLIAVSFHGNGPIATTFGPVYLSPPIHTLPFLVASPAGLASSTHSFPSWASGIDVHAHAAQALTLSSVSLSNYVTVTL